MVIEFFVGALSDVRAHRSHTIESTVVDEFGEVAKRARADIVLKKKKTFVTNCQNH